MFSQKTEIFDQSDFKHDYVMQDAEYLENIGDTVACKYVAVLRITTRNQPMNIVGATGRIAQTSKKLGANVFYLTSYTEKDSMITLTVRSFYAFKKAFDLNLTKKKKNKVIVFSTEKRSGFYQGFYLNDSLIKLNTLSYYQFIPTPGVKYTVRTFFNSGPLHISVTGPGTNSNSIPRATKVSFKMKEDTQWCFITIYTNEYKTKEEIREDNKSKQAICLVEEVGYCNGRLLLEILKPEN
jgi:hypothetical protein